MTEGAEFQPEPEHQFSLGLWTLGNRGRDPFGDAVRPTIQPVDIVSMLAEVGAWSVNLHDNDLVPIDATPRNLTVSCGNFSVSTPSRPPQSTKICAT